MVTVLTPSLRDFLVDTRRRRESIVKNVTGNHFTIAEVEHDHRAGEIIRNRVTTFVAGHVRIDANALNRRECAHAAGFAAKDRTVATKGAAHPFNPGSRLKSFRTLGLRGNKGKGRNCKGKKQGA